MDLFYPETFGQLGEDDVIYNHLVVLGHSPKVASSYLDIGSFHPTRGSNTFRFYRRGSKGVVVDIGNQKEKIWKLIRPRDVFINAAAVPNVCLEKNIDFFQGNNYGDASDHVGGFGVLMDRVKEKISVSTITASELTKICLNNSNWEKASWRLLNIDIEGLDEEFLMDLDLELLCPDIISIEHFIPKGVSFWDKTDYLVNSCSLVENLKAKGFSLQSICGPTLIFVRKKSSINKDLL